MHKGFADTLVSSSASVTTVTSISVASNTFCLLYRIYRILYGKCGLTLFYARVVDVFLIQKQQVRTHSLFLTVQSTLHVYSPF